MADWSGDHEVLMSSENEENRRAIIEFMVDEARHVGVSTDDKLTERGKDVALNGSWAGDIEGTSCVDCHSTMGEEFTKRSADDADGYPDLAKYGSAEWLKDFIRNPGSDQHYGAKNRMPAYADKLTESELELLVKWMTGDYYPTSVADYPTIDLSYTKLNATGRSSDKADEDGE